MFNLSKAGSLVFFTLYIHAFTLLCVLAAPVPVTPATSITGPSYNSHVLNKRLPQGPLGKRDLIRSPSHVSRSLVEREMQTLVRRKSIFSKIGDAFKKVGRGIKAAVQKVGQGIKAAATKVGQGIKAAATKVGQGIKQAAKKVGQGIKTAAQKVGQFVKTTGAKVAKFALKVESTIQSVASRVASFVPGIGKPISKALKGASMATNALSDKIHANLGKTLSKATGVLDKISHPLKGVAGEVFEAVTRREEDDKWILHRELDDLLLAREFDHL